MKTILFWSLLCASATAVATSSAAAADAADKAAAPHRTRTSAGKRQAPVTVTTDLAGELEAGSRRFVTVTIRPRRACTDLTTAVRGVDGVEVLGTLVRQHARCAAGVAELHMVQVSVPADASGTLVVDVTMQVRGRTYATSRAFKLRARGAPPAPKTLGTVEQGAEGPVEVMKARSK